MHSGGTRAMSVAGNRSQISFSEAASRAQPMPASVSAVTRSGCMTASFSAIIDPSE
jgi:hypothetical protein